MPRPGRGETTAQPGPATASHSLCTNSLDPVALASKQETADPAQPARKNPSIDPPPRPVVAYVKKEVAQACVRNM
jgi:hypothetical protein